MDRVKHIVLYRDDDEVDCAPDTDPHADEILGTLDDMVYIWANEFSGTDELGHFWEVKEEMRRVIA